MLQVIKIRIIQNLKNQLKILGFQVQSETVIIPIVCSIILFPTFVLAAILLLKHYNEKRRAKDRFRLVLCEK